MKCEVKVFKNGELINEWAIQGRKCFKYFYDVLYGEKKLGQKMKCEFYGNNAEIVQNCPCREREEIQNYEYKYYFSDIKWEENK